MEQKNKSSKGMMMIIATRRSVEKRARITRKGFDLCKWKKKGRLL